MQLMQIMPSICKICTGDFADASGHWHGAQSEGPSHWHGAQSESSPLALAGGAVVVWMI